MKISFARRLPSPHKLWKKWVFWATFLTCSIQVHPNSLFCDTNFGAVFSKMHPVLKNVCIYDFTVLYLLTKKYRLQIRTCFPPRWKKNPNLYLLNYKTTMSLRYNALISLGYKIFITKIYCTLNKC